MSDLVQLALAEDTTEAEEMRAILDAAGIASLVAAAVDQHPSAIADVPQKILVSESALEAAQHALEAMTGPDELVADA